MPPKWNSGALLVILPGNKVGGGGYMYILLEESPSLSVRPSVKSKLNLCYNFLTKREKACIESV